MYIPGTKVLKLMLYEYCFCNGNTIHMQMVRPERKGASSNIPKVCNLGAAVRLLDDYITPCKSQAMSLNLH